MTDFKDLVRKYIDDLRQSLRGFIWRKITTLEMRVPMKMVTRLRHAQEPVNGFQSLVCLGIVIVDPIGRGVCDEDIEGTTISASVQQQLGQHAERSEIRVRLGVLIGSIRAVADGAAKAADQKRLEAGHP